jgi:hypothetical protein
MRQITRAIPLRHAVRHLGVVQRPPSVREHNRFSPFMKHGFIHFGNNEPVRTNTAPRRWSEAVTGVTFD